MHRWNSTFNDLYPIKNVKNFERLPKKRQILETKLGIRKLEGKPISLPDSPQACKAPLRIKTLDPWKIIDNDQCLLFPNSGTTNAQALQVIATWRLILVTVSIKWSPLSGSQVFKILKCFRIYGIVSVIPSLLGSDFCWNTITRMFVQKVRLRELDSNKNLLNQPAPCHREAACVLLCRYHIFINNKS